MRSSVRGTETLLLVEDEPAVRRLAERTLDELGYRVVAAEDAAEALAIVEAAEVRFDLLVTDIVVGAMSGRELSARLRHRQPELKVLYTASYDAVHPERLAEHLAEIDRKALLPKPYLPAALADLVRDLLDK